MLWAEVEVDFIKQQWAEGLSASQIARLISTPARPISRNAVISKLHRLGAPQRVASAPRRTVAVRVAPVRRASAPFREPLLKPDGGKVTLLDLNNLTCRWPIGDPQEKDFHFCGRKPAPDLPYCEPHCRKAYQPQGPVKVPAEAA